MVSATVSFCLSACLVLGDNIFYGSGFTSLLRKAVEDAEKNKKATVFGYWVSDPERYGVAEFDKQGNCLSIEEKPKEPKSNYAVVGLYFYPNKVVDVAKHIKPSARGELEITTVNQEFLKDGELKVQVFGRGFAWLDTGTHDSLAEASTFVEVIEKRQGLKIACLEGIAYRNGWISEDKMMDLAKPMLKNQYGQYLLKVIEEMKENIKRHYGNSDEDLKDLGDIMDALKDLDELESLKRDLETSKLEADQKLKDLDKSWRDRYRERFFDGDVSIDDVVRLENDGDEAPDPADISIEDYLADMMKED